MAYYRSVVTTKKGTVTLVSAGQRAGTAVAKAIDQAEVELGEAVEEGTVKFAPAPDGVVTVAPPPVEDTPA